MSTDDVKDVPSVAAHDLIPLLDAVDSTPGAAELRARSYDLLRLAAGARVIDVGCGAGRAAAEMTERGARAVGVDIDEQMIALARERWTGPDFRVAAADHLPFADGELTGYRADKVYHVLDDPARALEEARRVVGPGGRIVLAGQDWESFVIDSADPGLTRTIVQARADTMPSPHAGRRYRNLLLDAGCTDVTVEVHTGVLTEQVALPLLSRLADAARNTGAITAEQAEAWTAEQTERGRTGRLFVAIPMFLAAGTRPATG
ncbi:methyltransferase domain-containing protein [Actinomadura sp. HBU206391]|uniref:methyltransferase domain-containing protein n=1 Tax=Actinomadura sp. HBU206391 TaxID=2731692 RepID=UPI00164FFC7A|nr:methyltransferase domain-containing protein [Actinomadura sp. HBU206391]MBC6462496.1 methyltransferase domain-containing protein [Actinomadura sp. HBU206391]